MEEQEEGMFKQTVQKTNEQNFSFKWQEKRHQVEVEDLWEKLGDPQPDDSNVLLILQDIPMIFWIKRKKEEVNCFIDTDSTCSLILTVYTVKRV